jgi:hypothetical protein
MDPGSEDLTDNQMKYGWSKWGGPRYGLLKDEKEWVCQACGEPQPKELPTYMLPLDSFYRDFVRICSNCKHIQYSRRISYYTLIKIVRYHGNWG